MSAHRAVIGSAIFFLFVSLSLITQAEAVSCEKVVSAINAQLPSPIDQQELIEMLRSLDRTNNKKLPSKFVTKHEARSRGWNPGEDLWSGTDSEVQALVATSSRIWRGDFPTINGGRRTLITRADTGAANVLSFPGTVDVL